MENKTALWNQVIEDSKKFGYHERLTPHIYALFKYTNKYLYNLNAYTVLDVGAGDKRYRDNIKCTKYISLDISGKMSVLSNATTLPFINKSFDCIICTQVLEHINNPFSAMEEFSRVLKENGNILITVPTVMYLHEIPNDYFRYTKYGIEYLLNKNNISIQTTETICSGFLVILELFLIALYSGIYKIIKSRFFRKSLVIGISYLSIITFRLDASLFRIIFPGNIIIFAYKTRKGDGS